MAILFVDTSALVRRYDRSEPGANQMRALSRKASGHQLVIARITPIELAAAFNRKVREGRFTPAQMQRHWRLFRTHWREQYRTVALSEEVLREAETLPFAHQLRGYDAVQLACALWVGRFLADLNLEVRFCTADQAQGRAAGALGLRVELIV